MQHSAAVMGVVPMTPEMWRRNSSPSNTDAMCNLPQFANSLGKRTVSPCYCNGIQVLLWEIGSRSPSVVLMPRLDGLGHQFVSRFRLFRRALLCAASAAKGHWNHLGATACAQGARDFLYCFKACVDSSPKPQRGSIPLLAMAPAPCSTPLL